jgi:hypothetical protein
VSSRSLSALPLARHLPLIGIVATVIMVWTEQPGCLGKGTRTFDGSAAAGPHEQSAAA